jgi:hypothetical protein
VVPIGFVSVCEKNVPYEMIMSFMLLPDAPGIPKPIKLQEQHKKFLPLDKPVGKQTGIELAAWCAGGAPAPVYDAAEEPFPEEVLDRWVPPEDAPDMPPDFGTSPPDIPEMPADFATGPNGMEEARASIAKAEKRQKERTAPGGPRKTVVAELARQAAEKGYEALKEFCSKLEPHERASIKELVVRELQPLAKAIDERTVTEVRIEGAPA